MDLPPYLVERHAGALLRLEPPVHVELPVRALDEERRQAGQDHTHDRDDGEHLDQRVATLAAQPAQAPGHFFAFACTRPSATRATSSLFEPTPQSCCARRSTWIRSSSASAPCHQPNSAPVTIHECW